MDNFDFWPKFNDQILKCEILNAFVNEIDPELTGVLEDLLIRLHHRAETVEDQCSEFGDAAFRWLVIVQRISGENKPALLQLQRSAFYSWFHLLMEPTWGRINKEFNVNQCLSRSKYSICLNQISKYYISWLTSHYELLSIGSGVTLGLLQQADPVVHLLRRVSVAVDHPVSRDDHKWVWPVKHKSCFSIPILRLLFKVVFKAYRTFLTCLGCRMRKQNQSSPRPVCPGQRKVNAFAYLQYCWIQLSVCQCFLIKQALCLKKSTSTNGSLKGSKKIFVSDIHCTVLCKYP